MISEMQRAEIKRLYYAEKWKVGSIARALGLHDCTIRRAIKKAEHKKKSAQSSPSLINGYADFLVSVVEEYPNVTATRLHQMIVERGYTGSVYPIRRFVSTLRVKKARAYQDLYFLPGEQAQIDWADLGWHEVAPGKSRKLNCFVMVLAYSRRMFAKVYYNQKQGILLEAHNDAFVYFQGSPRVCLYDNMKTAVIKNMGLEVQFNEALLQLAGFYNFKPRACNPRSGWEKGRVERSIRYLRDNFSPKTRSYSDIDSLNDQLLKWLRNITDKRSWEEDSNKLVVEAFHEEKLLPVTNLFDAYQETFVSVSKQCYFRFDANRYSCPPEYASQKLLLRATSKKVTIYSGDKLVCTHKRCWSKHEKIVDPVHIEKLLAAQRTRASRRNKTSVLSVLKQSKDLIKAWSDLEESLVVQSNEMAALLKQYSLSELNAAIELALDHGTPRADNIRYLLQQSPASAFIATKSHYKRTELNDIHVQTHDLSTYDNL